jgi:serine/threonine protein phosphatase 1
MKFVIGDIHGEISKLKSLMNLIYSKDLDAEIIFLGDYLNKGENSKAVLDYLLTLERCVFLMGNHEYYYLEYIKNRQCESQIKKHGLQTTFVDFNFSLEDVKEKLYDPYRLILDNLKLFYETSEYIVSHAGISIDMIKEDLNSIPAESFLFNRYDFIQYKHKIQGKLSIFGHTGFNFPYYDGVKIGLDTSAVYSKSNPLTAFCIETSEFFDSNESQYELSDLDISICPCIIRKQPYRQES